MVSEDEESKTYNILGVLKSKECIFRHKLTDNPNIILSEKEI